MKLISMTDFVLEQKKSWNGNEFEFEEIGKNCVKYANFIKQPLKLEMFVPCDDDGNFLEEPKGTNLESSFFEMQVDFNLNKKYQKAKEKVLFEGISLSKADYILSQFGYLNDSKKNNRIFDGF